MVNAYCSATSVVGREIDCATVSASDLFQLQSPEHRLIARVGIPSSSSPPSLSPPDLMTARSSAVVVGPPSANNVTAAVGNGRCAIVAPRCDRFSGFDGSGHRSPAMSTTSSPAEEGNNDVRLSSFLPTMSQTLQSPTSVQQQQQPPLAANRSLAAGCMSKPMHAPFRYRLNRELSYDEVRQCHHFQQQGQLLQRLPCWRQQYPCKQSSVMIKPDDDESMDDESEKKDETVNVDADDDCSTKMAADSSSLTGAKQQIAT